MTITTAQPTNLQNGKFMNKAAKIGIIALATIAVMTVGVIVFKKKLGKTQVALPSGKTINVSPEAAAIIAEAQKWVGVKEVGNNAGWENKDFEKLMIAAGWAKNAKDPNNRAYCASFVKMVLLQVSSGKAKEFFKKKLSALAKNTWVVLQNTEYSEKIDKPEAGAILCYEHHNEICESTDGKNNTVISANSPLGNDRNVQGVTRRTRGAGLGLGDDPFLGYIRIKKLS